MSSSTTVKIVCNGCIRRFVLPSPSFEIFRQLACQHAELDPASSLTFTFAHPACGNIVVSDTPTLERCLQVASSCNIIARLNVSTEGPSQVASLSPLSEKPAPTAGQEIRPQVTAAPVADALPFDLNGLVNGVFAQTGALFAGLQPQGSSGPQAPGFMSGILSHPDIAYLFASPQDQKQPSQPQQSSQPLQQPKQQPAQQLPQQQPPQQPQKSEQLPLDFGSLLSTIMAQPGIANILGAVQAQPQQQQQQQQPQQQQQQQQQQGLAQLFNSMVQGGANAAPFSLQQVLSLLQPAQQGQQPSNPNQLASMVQLAQTLGPLLPQIMGMMTTMMQPPQPPRPVAERPAPFGGLSALAQSFAQQALGTSPAVSASSANSADFSKQLDVLSGMGFNDRHLNAQLLREANGDVRVVFDQLRRREQFAASLGN